MVDRRVHFVELGKEQEGFSIDSSSGTLPEGLDSDLLYNLWDICSKFGQSIGTRLGFKSTPIQIELTDARNNGLGGKLGFSVLRVEILARIPSTNHFAILELKNGMSVLWDLNLSIHEVQEEIQAIDQIAHETGFIVDGERQIDYSI